MPCKAIFIRAFLIKILKNFLLSDTVDKNKKN